MKRWIHAATDVNWPSKEYWYSIEDDDEYDEAWGNYLSEPETQVSDELKIFAEPSTQGGRGSMFIMDTSGERRFNPISVDYMDWCDKEAYMAAASNSADEYKQKFKAYIEKLIEEAGPYDEDAAW